MKFLRTFLLSAVIFSFMAPTVFADGIVSGNDTALLRKTDYGVVSMITDQGDPIDVTSTAITGQAWGDVLGWIQFSGDNYEVTVTCDGDTATLGGYAWGENASWINFAPDQSEVTIDADGYFDGDAWSENYGWIRFNPATCPGGDGCVQTDFRCDPNPPPPPPQSKGGSVPACSINASQSNVSIPGSAVTLSWSINNANPNTITISGTSYNENQTLVVYPTQTTTYTGTVTKNGDQKTCSETVVVEKVAPEACPVFTKYFNLGSRDPEVQKVQQFLNGYMDEQLSVDGIYGFRTANAVGRFQTRHFDDIIKPWSPPLPLKITKRWYKTTLGTANVIVGCPSEPVYLEDPKVNHSFAQTMQHLFNIAAGIFSWGN